MSQLAAIRIRGGIDASAKAANTMRQLQLHRVNYCAVLPDTPTVRGMLAQVKDYTTWGELDAETTSELVKKQKKDQKFIRLHPPRGGHARKGIKKPFSIGGALGNRREKINALLRQML